MNIRYRGINYECEVIEGFVFAPPSLYHLCERASRSTLKIYEDSFISYYLTEEEVSLTDKQKLALIGIDHDHTRNT
jgi:hypothetical protein